MPLSSGDFVLRLSGGSSNSSGNASLGGVKSSNAASSTVDLLFDGVGSAEATAGDAEYRCVYLHNAGSVAMLDAVVWVSANTPSTSTTLDIGVGTAAINGTEQTIADESTAPSGVSFSAPSSQGAGLALGASIAAGEHKAIWLRRTITAGAGASASDTWTLGFAADFSS